jgi:hypothetical protein
MPITVTCSMKAPLPLRCEATVIDGTKLPIELASEGKEFAWHIAGIVVDTAIVARHLDRELEDLHVAQHASCGARIVVVHAGDRIACKLTGGGIAFVRVAQNGATSLELDLDAKSAAARGEVVTPAREHELAKISHGLEGLEGESDGEEAVVHDGGVSGP